MRQIILVSLLTLSSLFLTTSQALSQTEPAGGAKHGQPAKGEEICEPEGATSLVFSPDGRLVLTGGPVWGIRLFDFASGQELRRFTLKHPGYVKLAFSPDGRRALSYGFYKDIYLWDVESGQEIRRFAGGEGGTSRAYFTPDGRNIIAAGESDGLVRLLDVATGKELRSFKVDEKDDFYVLDISQDGRRAFSLTYHDTACLWDLEARRKLRCFQLAAREDFKLFDKRLALTNSETGILRWLDLENDQELPPMNGFEDKAVDDLSADGRLALAITHAGDFKVSLLNMRNGQEVVWLEINEDHSQQIFALTPDGLHVVGGCADKKLCVWDVKSGKRLRYFKTEK